MSNIKYTVTKVNYNFFSASGAPCGAQIFFWRARHYWAKRPIMTRAPKKICAPQGAPEALAKIIKDFSYSAFIF